MCPPQELPIECRPKYLAEFEVIISLLFNLRQGTLLLRVENETNSVLASFTFILILVNLSMVASAAPFSFLTIKLADLLEKYKAISSAKPAMDTRSGTSLRRQAM